ncbi:MAG: hypothetical protein HYY06_24610 [Deltaproteobacteria bacterium]|nr:hypothetical protein [Deltaproteobacteria bacterium]
MRRSSPFLIIGLALATLGACTSTPLESRTAQISEDVTVLEREPGIDVTVEDDRLVFPYAEDLADVAPGRVLVSGQGGGFLRRAVSVEAVGNDLVVATEPAALTDAIIEGEIQEQVDLVDTPEGPWASGWGGDGMGGFAIGLGGITVVGNGDLSVTIPEGRFDFQPQLDFSLDISHGQLRYFNLVASGDLDAALKMDVQIENAYAAGRFQVPVWKTSKMFMQMIGFVPVVEMVELSLGVGVQVDAMGAAHSTFGGNLHASVEAGARFEQGEWHAVGNKMVSVQVLPLVIEGDGMVGIRGFVYAEVAVMLYDAAGPALMIMPYVGVVHHEQIEQGEHQPHGWTPRVGVMGMFEAMLQVPIIGKPWIGYQAMLFDVYQDLGGEPMEGMGDSPLPMPEDGDDGGHDGHGGDDGGGGHSGH